MYRILISLFIMALVFIDSVNAQPKLEIVGGDSYNWNVVKPKESPLKATIILKNTGNEKLFISNVRPSCGCTAVLLDTSQLEPGQSAKLDVRLNISSKSGPVVKTVFIASNDPKSPNMNLYLKAEVQVDIEILPSQHFNFEDMKLGTEASSKLTLKNNSSQSVTFKDVSIAPDYVKINIPNEFELKPHEEKEIIATVMPKAKGYFGCALKMRTSHPEYPEISIQGSSVVSDPEKVIPSQKNK
ncbi:MAG: DUF1573 domain-containing protein [Ignavibacteriae bacterium]|nr:DUF1573 domain-containing protein [Ignavibacteriota bacterium]